MFKFSTDYQRTLVSTLGALLCALTFVTAAAGPATAAMTTATVVGTTVA